MRWRIAAAAAGVATIAIGLLRLVEREERRSERERVHEAWTRRPRQLELAGHRRYEGWRDHQPGEWG